MKTLLKSISLLLCVITVLLSLPSTSSAAAVEDKAPFDVDALSALLMDSATGEVLCKKRSRSPASGVGYEDNDAASRHGGDRRGTAFSRG